MRISTQMMQRHAVNSILDRQVDLNRTQQQLARGSIRYNSDYGVTAAA